MPYPARTGGGVCGDAASAPFPWRWSAHRRKDGTAGNPYGCRSARHERRMAASQFRQCGQLSFQGRAGDRSSPGQSVTRAQVGWRRIDLFQRQAKQCGTAHRAGRDRRYCLAPDRKQRRARANRGDESTLFGFPYADAQQEPAAQCAGSRGICSHRACAARSDIASGNGHKAARTDTQRN